MRSSLAVLMVGLVAGSPAMAAPPGWQPASDHAGKCHTAVPPNWVPGEYHLGMQAPGGHGILAMSSSDGDLGLAKQVAGSTMDVVTTLDDTPKRYWMEFADRMGRPFRHWYVAVPAAGVTCALTLDFDATLPEADAKAIVEGFGGH